MRQMDFAAQEEFEACACMMSSSRQVSDLRLHKKRSSMYLQNGGMVKVEVVIGTPVRGPFHLALRHANPGTLFSGQLQHHILESCLDSGIMTLILRYASVVTPCFCVALFKSMTWTAKEVCACSLLLVYYRIGSVAMHHVIAKDRP